MGVTGPIGAGTDTFAQFLIEKGFVWMSYSDVLRQEMKKEGIPLERYNIIAFANDLRREHGLGVISQRILGRMEDGRHYVIGNIRNPGEVEVLRNSGEEFVLVHIDAPLETRFERAKQRNREQDPRTLEEFRTLDAIDRGIGQESHGQQHEAVFELADRKIVNDDSFESLREKAELLVQELGIS